MKKLTNFSVVLAFYTLWIAICALVFGLALDFFASPYFSFGPSDSLYVIGLGLYINTWLKYWLLMSYSVASPFVGVYVGDTIYPWINSVVMNPDVKEMDVSKPIAWLITNYMWVLFALSNIFGIGVSMTQFDLFLAAQVGSITSGMITSYIAVSAKSTATDSELDEVV
jgi:hypothetical protein